MDGKIRTQTDGHLSDLLLIKVELILKVMIQGVATNSK